MTLQRGKLRCFAKTIFTRQICKAGNVYECRTTRHRRYQKGFALIIDRIKADPKVPLMVAGAAAIAVIVALFLWMRSPDYRVLLSNLSAKDGGDIVSQLTQMNMPYQLADNGSAILVPADKVHELRLKLAQAGLPKGGNTGFELLDKEQFGISQFSEQVNYQRALEGTVTHYRITQPGTDRAGASGDPETDPVCPRAEITDSLRHRRIAAGPRTG